MTKTRIEKLTSEELDIVLKAFRAPSFLKANINAGGSYTVCNMTITKENGEYIATIKED